MSEVPAALAAWTGLDAIAPVIGGARNRVWQGVLRRPEPPSGLGPDGAVSIRISRRSGPSLAWELGLLDRLDRAGFRVPQVIAADDGRLEVDGVVVQAWLGGREPRDDEDWHRVAEELGRLHRLTTDHGQRPGCCPVTELAVRRRSVDADLDRVPPDVERTVVEVFAAVADVAVAVVHGDPGPGNIRIDDDGRVGLLDWDESRVDVVWHDLSNLGVAVLGPTDRARAERLSDAWEAVNGWVAEPAYARRRLARLRGGAGAGRG